MSNLIEDLKQKLNFRKQQGPRSLTVCQQRDKQEVVKASICSTARDFIDPNGPYNGQKHRLITEQLFGRIIAQLRLILGGSSAMNLVCAVKQGRKHEGSNIVTVAHDSGIRYIKKLFSDEYLRTKGIKFQRKESYAADDLSFVL